MSERLFPIRHADAIRKWNDEISKKLPAGIPWGLMELHREQALKNTKRSLEQIEKEGGLDAVALFCVLNDTKPLPEEINYVVISLGMIVRKWNESHAKPEAPAAAAPTPEPEKKRTTKPKQEPIAPIVSDEDEMPPDDVLFS